MQCSEGLSYLSKLNALCGAPRGHAGCSRVSCSHNCGIFLCNDVSLPAPFLFSRLDRLLTAGTTCLTELLPHRRSLHEHWR
jgi:hypothetical protein